MEKEGGIEKNIANSPTAEKLEGNTLDDHMKDQLIEEMKSLNTGEDKCKEGNDSGQHDLGDKMNRSRVEESEVQGEKLDSKVQHDNLGKMDESRDMESKVVEHDDLGKMNECRNLVSKAQGEKLDDNLGKMDGSQDSESKVVECDDLGKMDESRDLESKAPGEKFDDDLGKMDGSQDSESKVVERDDLGKMDESTNLESKAHRQNLDDNMGKMDESRGLESKVVEYDEVGKMDGSKDLESKVVEHDELGRMDENTDLESVAQGEKLNDNMSKIDENRELESKFDKCDEVGNLGESTNLKSEDQIEKLDDKNEQVDSVDKMNVVSDLDTKAQVETNGNTKEMIAEEEKEQEPVFDGTEVPGMEANRSTSTRSTDLDSEVEGSAWPEKAVAIKNFVKEKGVVAVANVLRRLSGKNDEIGQDDSVDENKEASDSGKESKDSKVAEVNQKTVERSSWNPLNYIKMSSDIDGENKSELREEKEPLQTLVMKGRIILYTRLGCKDCKEMRSVLQQKRLRYFEINIDVYPGRKLELEKISGSSAVPKVFFNEILIGGVSEFKGLDESRKLNEKIDYLINEAPSFEAPSPPLSGEDDLSTSGAIDELALIVLKMKDSVVVKDRFYKMRRFTSCFTGSEAVNFLSEDQYLERKEAVEFGRKLASKLFFQHVLDENLFEDGNHLYRFLDHDPNVSQCQNIPRGIIDAKPKPISEIASRLRYLCYAIFEAYVSEDGRHVDYRSIHGSEEFARYLRTVQELQRVELQTMPREEKLAFFINLYNMMAIHAILLWGHPAGALERRKMFGEFKYVIGGWTYSLSAIQNGILRGNQRPPYNLMKPFGANDKRSQVVLPYSEPPIHFTLVCGTQSGPALRCYSPGNIDKELVEAAHNFLRGGGLIVDLQAKVASISKILKWFSVDFGKNEMEVLKHASNYLEPTEAEPILEVLSNSQLKVIHQPYDWGLNC